MPKHGDQKVLPIGMKMLPRASSFAVMHRLTLEKSTLSVLMPRRPMTLVCPSMKPQCRIFSLQLNGCGMCSGSGLFEAYQHYRLRTSCGSIDIERFVTAARKHQLWFDFHLNLLKWAPWVSGSRQWVWAVTAVSND